MNLDYSSTVLPAGPIEVDLDMPAVHQLWPEVSRVIRMATAVTLPFLKLFGVEDGNGLSPFAVDIGSPDALADIVKEYFKPPKSDPRDRSAANGGDDEEEEDEVVDSDDDDGDDGDDNESPPTISASYLKDKLNELAELDSNSDDDKETSSDDKDEDDSAEKPAATEDDSVEKSVAIEHFFDSGNASEALKMLRELLGQRKIAEIPQNALNLAEQLELGKIEQGSVSMAGGFKSLQARWFGQKKRKGNKKDEMDVEEVVWIERDTLIKMKYKRGQQESEHYYRVFGIFTKHSNKWFVELETKIVRFEPHSKGWKTYSKKYKLQTRMMKKDSFEDFEDVDLKKDGNWSSKAVFRNVSLADVLSVEIKLDSSTDWSDW